MSDETSVPAEPPAPPSGGVLRGVAGGLASGEHGFAAQRAQPPPGTTPGQAPVWDRVDGGVAAGAAIVASTGLVLFSALVSAFSRDRPGGVRSLIKTLGLGSTWSSGRILVVSGAGAALAALGLVLALACIHGKERGKEGGLVTAVAVVAAAEAGWLLLFTLLSLPVDLSLFGDAGFSLVITALLGDLASTVLLAVVPFWAVQMLLSRGHARTARDQPAA